MSDDSLRRAIRCTLLGLALCLVILLVSGLWLVWNYRPTESISAGSTWGTAADRVTRLHLAQDTHRWMSRLVVLGTVGLAVELVLLVIRRRRVTPIALGVPTVLVALAAALTGFRLPWDQVAVWAVTVGTDDNGRWTSYKGFGLLFDDNVQYLAIGSAEINPGTLARWFWVHTTVLPLALLGLGVALTYLIPRRRGALTSPAGPDVGVTHETSGTEDEERGPWHSTS